MGPARLRLGIVGVGFWVVTSVCLLVFDAPSTLRSHLPNGMSGDAVLMGLMLALYVLIQTPFDLLGGYIIPKRYARPIQPFRCEAWAWLRGVVGHGLLLSGSAAAIYTGGFLGGWVGACVAGLIGVSLLAACRGLVARVVASLPPDDTVAEMGNGPGLHAQLRHSQDEGFTGGITGFVTPKLNVMPAAWRDELTADGFALADARRESVIRSGAWRAGRYAALIYTALGLFLALLLAGPHSAGTAVGVVETSLWFTLWSFGGLLTLPSLSRRAVYRIDRDMLDRGNDPQAYHQLWSTLDGKQDDEPTRNKWVERIFHPVPSVTNRTNRDKLTGVALWDVARTSVYLGIGGLSLLTRSVHCNVGRPELWIWLPTD
ncbi:MAG: hypothetical protein AAGH99_07835 [Planctomycetota bacterium]